MGFLNTKKQADITKETVPAPEEVADPQDVGANRAKEDKELYGSSAPDLRVRSELQDSQLPAGSGLRLM